MKAIRASLAIVLGSFAVAGAGCGGPSMSVVALRTQVNGICTRADTRLRSIRPVRDPAATRAFLLMGLDALEPELRGLGRVSAPQQVRGEMTTGVRALAGELGAIRLTVRQLGAGTDPVVAFAGLQQRLVPLERSADDAWHALRTPACLSR